MCPGLLRFACHWLSIRLFSPNALIKVPPSVVSSHLTMRVTPIVGAVTDSGHGCPSCGFAEELHA